MLSSIGLNERGRRRTWGRATGGGNWKDSECKWRKLVGPEIWSRRVDDDDRLENQVFLTALLSRLAGRRRRALSLSFSLSRSSAISYGRWVVWIGSADGRGTTAGWSRRTTMFLPGLDVLDRGFSRAPQHDARELNKEEKVSDNMLPPGLSQLLERKNLRHA